MKIYLISQAAAASQLPLVASYLSKVHLPPSQLTPVVVIDDHQWQAEESIDPSALRCFDLDDFLHARGSVTSGDMTADANVIAEKLRASDEPWLFIDLGLHNHTVTKDFIRKLATFTFLFQTLHDRNLVLLMPRLYLGFMGRYVNELFNNTPVSLSTQEVSSRFNLFLLSVVIEKLYMSSFLVAWPISKFRQLTRFVYDRLIRVKA